MAGTAAGIGLLVTTLRSLGEILKDARDYARETAAENLKLQDSLRELAALQGKPAPDPGTMRGVMERVMQSAMTEEEATGFEVMWGSAIDAARAGGHWHLNAKQEEELKTQAGTFATRNKISPETMGKWVPLIGKEEDINSPEQMMGKIALMQEMARTGVGHVEPIYKAAKDLRGQPGQARRRRGRRGDRRATHGHHLVSHHRRGPRRTKQSIRQTFTAIQDPKVMEKLGMKSDEDFIARIGHVRAYLNKTRAAGEDDLKAMKKAGFKNQNASLKVVQFANNVEDMERRAAIVGRGRTPAAQAGARARPGSTGHRGEQGISGLTDRSRADRRG